ncbi:hypothetical protein T484DRAFT_1984975 [Baffinella frigidus]|nr:hypothetical protein T484DRAFT_1984975 [Cryptophyta sp. CCMP2293]
MERRKGAFSSEIRVMGWVNFIGAEETASASSVGSTSWSLFREVTAEIRKSARECGNVVERVPILNPETGEAICALDPDGRELRGTATFVRISTTDPVRVLQLPRDDLVPPADGRHVALRNERRQEPERPAPSNEVPPGPVATESGSGGAARVLVYCAQRRGDGIDVYSEAKKLKKMGDGKKLTFDIEIQTTFDDFHDTMIDACKREVRMVHFMGHGGVEGGLMWVKENNERESESIDPASIAEAMHMSFYRDVEGGGGGTIEACVLNACSTIPLAVELRRRGLKHAVCWRGAVRSDVAIQFSQWFYRFLEAHPGKYREAFNAGKMQVEVLQKRRLRKGSRKPVGSVCLLSEAGDILPEGEEEEAWLPEREEEEAWEEEGGGGGAGGEPSGAPGGGGGVGLASAADDDDDIRSVNNAKGEAELEAIAALGFPLVSRGGHDILAGIRDFKIQRTLQTATLLNSGLKYGLQELQQGSGGQAPPPPPCAPFSLSLSLYFNIGLSPDAVVFLFADVQNFPSDALIKNYTSNALWGDGGPLVRRSETVTPGRRDEALQKLAESIKLRTAEMKKRGGGNAGHHHMLAMLQECESAIRFRAKALAQREKEAEDLMQGLSQMAVDEEAFPSLGGPATQRASKGKSGRF